MALIRGLLVLLSDMWIRIRIASGINGVSRSGFRIRAKTSEKRRQLKWPTKKRGGGKLSGSYFENLNVLPGGLAGKC